MGSTTQPHGWLRPGKTRSLLYSIASPHRPSSTRVTVMIVDANADGRRVIKQIFGNLADVIHECATPVAAFADYRQFNRMWS